MTLAWTSSLRRSGHGGRVLRRLTDRYSLVVHPYIADCQSGHDGEFETGADRRAVCNADPAAQREGNPAAGRYFEIPGRAALLAAMRSIGEPWQTGPYGAGAGTCSRVTLGISARWWLLSTSSPAGSAPGMTGWSSPTASQTRPTC